MGCLSVKITRVGGLNAELSRIGGMDAHLIRKGGLKARLGLICRNGKDITIITFGNTVVTRNEVAVGYEQ